MKTLFRLQGQPVVPRQALAHFTAWYLDEDRPWEVWKLTAQDAEGIFNRGAYKGEAHCRRMLASAGIELVLVGAEDGPFELTN